MLFWNLSLLVLDNFRCLLTVSRSIQRRLDQRCRFDIQKRCLMRLLKWDLFLAQRLGNLPDCNSSGNLG